MKFNLAFTAPINSPIAFPVLSRSQFWEGLIEKCRCPQNFLSAIANCEILDESETGMKRIITFRDGLGPPGGKVTEILTFHGHTTIDVLMIETGTFITNTISAGLTADDIYLTFTFDAEFPDIEEGTQEAEERCQHITEEAAAVVPQTIHQIRTLARQGKL